MDTLQAPSKDPQAAARRRLQVRLAIGLGVLLLAGAAWWVAQLLSKPKAVRKPSAQQIALVRPNTPPPPPPKPQEKPPEPPKQQDEVKMDTPKPPDAPKAADEPPPAAKLGVDAAGNGEGDNFGLAANKGGRDLTAAPTIGGGAGAPSRLAYGFYRDVVTRHINDELNRVDALKGTDGQVAVLVWIDRTGRIERVELRDASDEQTRLIRERLLASRAMREPPPDTMPQPVWVLLNLRELG